MSCGQNGNPTENRFLWTVPIHLLFERRRKGPLRQYASVESLRLRAGAMSDNVPMVVWGIDAGWCLVCEGNVDVLSCVGTDWVDGEGADC